MIKIEIKAYSWIAKSLGLPELGTSTLKKSLENGLTIQQLFAVLAEEYPEFANQVYNPVSGVLNNRLIVIFNTKTVRDVDMTNTQLKEGDVVSLTPIIAGG